MKVSKILILLISFIFCHLSFAQDSKYPKGVYLSFKEIVNKSPSLPIELEINKRTKGEIKMNGGNDYKLYKPDKSISRKRIKKEFFGYSNGDTLYINCFHYKVQPWYASIISDGKFLVIKGGLSMVPETRNFQLKNKAQLGIMFGAIGGAIQGAKLAMLRFVYTIDKETNDIRTVSSDYLKGLLYNNSELLKQFKMEKEPNAQEVFIKYLKLLNEQ